MTALQVLRTKKFNREPLTAAEEIILDAWYTAKDSLSEFRMAKAEMAANELADLGDRILKYTSRIYDLESAMENMS